MFLLLLLLNVVFFTWQINRATENHDPYADRLKPNAQRMQGIRTIYLLSEVGRTPHAVAVRAPVEKPPPLSVTTTGQAAATASSALCFRAGPFLSAKRATETGQRLGEQGIAAATTTEEEPVATMYWVSLPTVATFDAAKQQFAELQKRGIEDLGIVNERPGYSVSLGFYRQPGSARRRNDEISALGYQPRITERQTTRQITWLDFRRPAGSGNDALSAALASILVDIPARSRDCDAASGELADTGR